MSASVAATAGEDASEISSGKLLGSLAGVQVGGGGRAGAAGDGAASSEAAATGRQDARREAARAGHRPTRRAGGATGARHGMARLPRWSGWPHAPGEALHAEPRARLGGRLRKSQGWEGLEAPQGLANSVRAAPSAPVQFWRKLATATSHSSQHRTAAERHHG